MVISGELATRIAGRYLTLQVFPLTLAEFGQLHASKTGAKLGPEELFRTYLRLGGVPGLLHTDFLGSQRRSASVDTVLNYLAYLDEAFLLNVVRRYDLKGKKHLETNAKYYLGDIGLRNGMLGYHETDIGGVLENLVYLELRRRGYRVSVGSAESREIDFVAEDRSGILYVQVAYLLESRKTLERELKLFSLLDDAYPRYLLTLDPHQPQDLQGVRHRSLEGFLRGDSLK